MIINETSEPEEADNYKTVILSIQHAYTSTNGADTFTTFATSLITKLLHKKQHCQFTNLQRDRIIFILESVNSSRLSFTSAKLILHNTACQLEYVSSRRFLAYSLDANIGIKELFEYYCTTKLLHSLPIRLLN